MTTARFGEPEGVDALTAATPDLGARIRAARLERGLSLTQMGGDELSPSFLSMVERGKSRISLRALSLIAERLELPISYFMDESDSAGVELTLQRAEADLLRGDAQRCLDLLAALTPAEPLVRRLLWLRGRALMELDQLDAAVETLRAALAQCEERHDLPLLADVQYLLAETLFWQRSYEPALAHARIARAALAQNPDNPMLARNVAMLVGDILTAQGSRGAALASYQEAATMLDAVRDLPELASTYAGMSSTYEASGAVEPALRYARMAVAALQAYHDAHTSAEQLVTVAERYREQGDLDRAREYGVAALARAAWIGDAAVERRGRIVVARVALAREDLGSAEREAQIVLDASPAGSEDTAEAEAVLAAIAAQGGDHGRADELYRRSLDTFMTLSKHRRYEDVAVAYSRHLRERGDVEGALEYALLAIDARSKAGESADRSS